MLFIERWPLTGESVKKGCFGDIFQLPVNAYGCSALNLTNKFKQKKSYSSRSKSHERPTRTLEYNRRTLSPNPRYGYIRHCFAPLPNLQNQADNSPPG
jgi:hypothetical protein